MPLTTDVRPRPVVLFTLLDGLAGPVRPVEVASIQGHPIGVEQVGQEHRPVAGVWEVLGKECEEGVWEGVEY